MAPSPAHTSFPHCYLGDRLSCIVSFSSSFPLFHPNCSLTTPPPLETLIQTEALELTTCPRALIYERGEPKLSYQNRPVFHPFIWHLKSNYTNMVHGKTRAHCSKFRFGSVDLWQWWWWSWSWWRWRRSPSKYSCWHVSVFVHRGRKSEKHSCQSDHIFSCTDTK